MRIQELIKRRSENIIDTINNRWGICREGNGSKYVNSPLPEKEYFIEQLEDDVASDERVLEDDNMIDTEGFNRLIEAAEQEISEAYDSIVISRSDFLDSVDEYYETICAEGY